MIDSESRAASLDQFDSSAFVLPPLAKPVAKPLDVHVARAAQNNLILNVVNTNYEIRKVVISLGIEFHNNDTNQKAKIYKDPNLPGQLNMPVCFQNDLPDIVLQGDKDAVYISDAQRVEYHIQVVDTKDEFKKSLETPGIHAVYAGHSRFGRGPCFGPDLAVNANGDLDKKGENWESGADPAHFGLFRMGHPFVGVPFSELTEHQYRIRPVPASVRVSPSDIDPTTSSGLHPIPRKGSPFENLIIDNPPEDTYWGCTQEHGPGVLVYADWQNSKAAPMDLGATNIQCRCFSVMACSTMQHFHDILRQRKRYTRSDLEGFAYFTSDAANPQTAARALLSSWFEYNERNDFQSWYKSLEFAVKRGNQKLAAARQGFHLI